MIRQVHDPLEPKPPESFQKARWLLQYGWTYKWYVLVAVVFLAIYAFVKWPRLPSWKDNKVTATVLAFDPNTAQLSLRLNNGTDQPVMLTHIYYTFFTADSRALKPISIQVANECSSGLTKVPETGGFESMHRELREEIRVSEPRISLDWGIVTNRWLVRLIESSLLSIDAGKSLLTNLVPYSVGFRSACDVFMDNTPLELAVHFSLLGTSASKGIYEVDLPLGIFTRGPDGSWFVPKAVFPMTIDLKQFDPRSWKHVKLSSIPVPPNQWTTIKPAEFSTENGLYYVRVMTESNIVFLCLGEILTNRSTAAKVE